MSRNPPDGPPITESKARHYHETGILFPIPVLTRAEQQTFSNAVAEMESLLGTNAAPPIFGQCHLNLKWAYDLCTHVRVLDAVEQIIGPDIIVHSTTLFSKKPGRSFVSWHQDSTYWGLSEPKLVSAWIALSDSTVENGCMRVQPGTHLHLFDHTEIRHEHNMLSTGTTVQHEFDETAAIDVVLRSGEMSLHHAHLVHGSNPNRSSCNRVGFAVRYVAPEVRQELGHHEVILARGCDRYHYYEVIKKTPEHSVQEGLPFHIAFSRWHNQRNLDGINPGPA